MSCAKHDMLENRTNNVDIDDCEPSVFKQLLQYIYTAECGEIEDPLQLYLQADKYLLADLKSLCEEAFYSQLTCDNVEEKLSEAVLHAAHGLKRKAMEFICKNPSGVQASFSEQ